MIALIASTPLHAQRDTLSASAAYTRGLILEQIDGETERARELYSLVSRDRWPDVVGAKDGADRMLRDTRVSIVGEGLNRFSIIDRAKAAAHRRRTGTRHISTVPSAARSTDWVSQLKALMGFGRYVQMGRDPGAFIRRSARLEDDYQAAMIRDKSMDDPVSASRRYRSIAESYGAHDERVVRSSELIQMVKPQ